MASWPSTSDSASNRINSLPVARSTNRTVLLLPSEYTNRLPSDEMAQPQSAEVGSLFVRDGPPPFGAQKCTPAGEQVMTSPLVGLWPVTPNMTVEDRSCGWLAH